jgi:hypothetical protein
MLALFLSVGRRFGRRFALIFDYPAPEIRQEICLLFRAHLKVSRVDLSGLLFVVPKKSLQLGQAHIPQFL